jgi:inhibitor of cysteine peptidase
MDRIVLDESLNGQEIGVPVGVEVELVLRENPTTGFRWNWDTPAGLVIDSERVPGGPRLGAGGIRRLSIRARRPGRHELRLRLVREWGEEPASELRFTLLVSEEPGATRTTGGTETVGDVRASGGTTGVGEGQDTTTNTTEETP